MAITRIPPISSTTAKAVRKIFRLRGTRFPSKLNTPNEKAISVAIGMASPCPPTLPGGQISIYIIMGTSMPPQAAIKGNAALRKEESSPTSNSRLISSPTSKKKIVIKPSLINSIIRRFSPPCESKLKLPICK